jgi:hypothetical protein
MGSAMIGFSGAVSGLSAHFTAGSSQVMHWRSVRPDQVTTGTRRFPHLRQRVIGSMRSLPIFLPVTRNCNFCSIRAFRARDRSLRSAARCWWPCAPSIEGQPPHCDRRPFAYAKTIFSDSNSHGALTRCDALLMLVESTREVPHARRSLFYGRPDDGGRRYGRASGLGFSFDLRPRQLAASFVSRSGVAR